MSSGREPLPPDSFRSLLESDLPRFDVPLPAPGDLERLARFLAELDRWRARFNLTGKLSRAQLVEHTAESLLGERFLPPSARVADIGTGGGFPGVPLAIVRADLDVTWVEPREKRATFLRHVQRSAPVANARIVAARSEDLPRDAFDAATSRAVSVTGDFRDFEFLAKDGVLLLWTTDRRPLAERLAPRLRLEQALAIPYSRERQIAVFRRI